SACPLPTEWTAMSWTDFQKVLPSTARVNAAGHLELGGCDALALTEEYGTPVFVCDLSDVRERLGRYRDAFGGDNVFYASKAFLTKTFAPIVAGAGVGMDCVAGGELYVAVAGGFPAGRITVHGNNPSRSELTDAVRAGVARIVVDSFQELELLDDVGRDVGT